MVLDKVREICAEQGISVAEACRRAEISRDTVMDWKDHNPTATNLLKMAAALNVSPTVLLEDLQDDAS